MKPRFFSSCDTDAAGLGGTGELFLALQCTQVGKHRTGFDVETVCYFIDRRCHSLFIKKLLDKFKNVLLFFCQRLHENFSFNGL
jgi:hypothetical protein